MQQCSNSYLEHNTTDVVDALCDGLAGSRNGYCTFC
jgi:hypothetical protein